MSLLAAVSEWEARKRVDETRDETPMKQAKQVFHDGAVVSHPVKHAEPQKSAISRPCFTVSPPRAGNNETPLSEEILEGICKLRSGWQPRRIRLPEWRGSVEDALRLSDDGWAANALALGWSAYDVFGIGSGGSSEWLSLAVWLNRRSLTMMDDHRAFTAEGDVYYLERWGRPNAEFVEPIYLWELVA